MYSIFISAALMLETSHCFFQNRAAMRRAAYARRASTMGINKTCSHSLNGSWVSLPVKVDFLSPSWIESASSRTSRNYSLTCKSDCGMNVEQKGIYASTNEVYIPFHCSTHVFSIEDACKCMQKYRVILGFGDSFMRRILSSWMTDSVLVNAYEKETRAPDNATVLEESSFLPCEHTGSVNRVFKLSAWLFQHLYTKVLPTLDSFQAQGLEVDLLFVGFGIHNIWQNATDISLFIRDTIEVLTRHPSTLAAHIFWILPHWTDTTKLMYPYNISKASQNDRILSFNNLVKQHVVDAAPSWTVLDFFPLTIERANKAQDAAHFDGSVFRWKNQILLNSLCS